MTTVNNVNDLESDDSSAGKDRRVDDTSDTGSGRSGLKRSVPAEVNEWEAVLKTWNKWWGPITTVIGIVIVVTITYNNLSNNITDAQGKISEVGEQSEKNANKLWDLEGKYQGLNSNMDLLARDVKGNKEDIDDNNNDINEIGDQLTEIQIKQAEKNSKTNTE